MTYSFGIYIESPIYYSLQFTKVLIFAKTHPKFCIFVEKNDRHTLSFESMHDIDNGIRLVEKVGGEGK